MILHRYILSLLAAATLFLFSQAILAPSAMADCRASALAEFHDAKLLTSQPKPSLLVGGSIEITRNDGYSIGALNFASVPSDHLEQMQKLVNAAFNWDQDIDEFTDSLRWGLNPIVVVAQFKGQVIGVLTSRCDYFKEHGNEQYITGLAVDPLHRKQGIAQDLLQSLIKLAQNQPIQVDTNHDNLAALSLYRKLGFQELFREDTGVFLRRPGAGVANVQLVKRDPGSPYNFVNTLVRETGEVLVGSEEIPTDPIGLEDLLAEYGDSVIPVVEGLENEEL